MTVPNPVLSILPPEPLITPPIVVDEALPKVNVFDPSTIEDPDTAVIEPIVSELDNVNATLDAPRVTATES